MPRLVPTPDTSRDRLHSVLTLHSVLVKIRQEEAILRLHPDEEGADDADDADD